MCTQGDGGCLQEKQERRPQSETYLTGTLDHLILDVSASRTERNILLLSKPPIPWYFVMTAWAD